MADLTRRQELFALPTTTDHPGHPTNELGNDPEAAVAYWYKRAQELSALVNDRPDITLLIGAQDALRAGNATDTMRHISTFLVQSGCTGAIDEIDGTLSHDGDTCPIHEGAQEPNDTVLRDVRLTISSPMPNELVALLGSMGYAPRDVEISRTAEEEAQLLEQRTVLGLKAECDDVVSEIETEWPGYEDELPSDLLERAFDTLRNARRARRQYPENSELQSIVTRLTSALLDDEGGASVG